jgi:hypothetical protein
MKNSKTILTILIVYYIMIATILWLGFSGKINFWLTPLKTVSGLTIFIFLTVLTQLIFSSERIKSKLVSIVFFYLLLVILLFCFFMVIAEWTDLSEDIFGYIALALSIIICLIIGLYYYKKHKEIEIKEWLIKSSYHLLLISVSFTAIFLLSYLLLPVVASKTNKFFTFLGFGSMISLYTGTTIFLWTLGTYLIIRIKK